MNIIRVKDYTEMSRRAADIIADIIRNMPSVVIGVATGSTPIGAYRELINKYLAGSLSFADVTTFNLDEYIGLSAENEHSYHAYMRNNFTGYIDIDPQNVYIPNGDAIDADAECRRYSELLKAHPRDIQILGLGRNGHIAFNEPGTPFDSVTHVVELTQDTIEANSRLFDKGEAVPKTAITMGISEIISAKKIIMLASGANKAEAVRAMVKGDVDTACPASILSRHPDATLIVDREAASEIV